MFTVKVVAMDVVDFQLSGFDELEKQLEQLELATQKRILRQAVRESAKPIEDQMRTAFHQQWDDETGQLAGSIATRVTIPRNPTFADVVASVGVYKNRSVQLAAGKEIDAPVYAYWLEHGTRAHSLAGSSSLREYSAGPRRRERKRIDRPDQGEGGQHPGITAGPFIRPSFDSRIEASLEIQKTTLSDAIDRALRRQLR